MAADVCKYDCANFGTCPDPGDKNICNFRAKDIIERLSDAEKSFNMLMDYLSKKAPDVKKLWEELESRDSIFVRAKNEIEFLRSTLSDLRETHANTVIRIGEMCGADLSDEPRAKWALLEVSKVVKERDSLRVESLLTKEPYLCEMLTKDQFVEKMKLK